MGEVIFCCVTQGGAPAFARSFGPAGVPRSPWAGMMPPLQGFSLGSLRARVVERCGSVAAGRARPNADSSGIPPSSAPAGLAAPSPGEFVCINTRLPEKSRQRAHFQLTMHRHHAPLLPAPKYDVAAPLPHLHKTQGASAQKRSRSR
jgi:hypothetical protein